MKPYTGNELVMAAHRSFYALYSYLKAMEKDDELASLPNEETQNHPTLTLLFFYEDNFTLNLSELLYFFETKEDERIISLLKTSEEQRLRLRYVRHSNAHLDNATQTMRRKSELDIGKVLPYLLTDLMTVIYFIRDIIDEKESREAANKYIEHINQIRLPFAEMLKTGMRDIPE